MVFATETLALGINMPARTVVLERLVKWNGENHVDITPGEYTQLTGRAGRRGIDVEGHAVVVWHPGLDPQQLWVHNMQVAGAARHLGARLGLNAELAFACGLLHTVGEAVLHLAMPAEMRVFDQGIALLAPHRAAAQRHAFGYTQAEIGGELALRWNFPTLLVQAIAGSDEPLAQSEWSPLAATLHLADWFVRAHGAGLTQQALRNAWPNSVAERLAWADHDALDQLIAWAGVQRH
jgi:HD-like signal output (HDOD) protein